MLSGAGLPAPQAPVSWVSPALLSWGGRAEGSCQGAEQGRAGSDLSEQEGRPVRAQRLPESTTPHAGTRRTPCGKSQRLGVRTPGVSRLGLWFRVRPGTRDLLSGPLCPRCGGRASTGDWRSPPAYLAQVRCCSPDKITPGHPEAGARPADSFRYPGVSSWLVGPGLKSPLCRLRNV